MAEPTLKEILDAVMSTKADVAKLESRFDKVDTRLDRVENRLEKVDTRLEKVETRLGAVEKQVNELDRDLNEHMDVHREIEKDITLLKRRPPRTAARPARRRSR